MDAPQTTVLSDLSFEDAMRELELLVRRLEEGRIPLKEAISVYERGTLLRQHAEKLLSEARLKIDQIIVKGDGSISSVPSSLNVNEQSARGA